MSIIKLFEQTIPASAVIKALREFEDSTRDSYRWRGQYAISFLNKKGIDLQVLGEGSFKKVYKINNAFVLKLNITDMRYGTDCAAILKKEVEVTNKLDPIVAKIYAHSPDYNWVITELVNTFDSNGISLNDFLMENYPNYYIVEGREGLGFPIANEQKFLYMINQLQDHVASIKDHCHNIEQFGAEIENTIDNYLLRPSIINTFCINFKELHKHYPFDIDNLWSQTVEECQKIGETYEQCFLNIEPYMKTLSALVQRYELVDLHQKNLGWVQSSNGKRLVIIDFMT